MQVEALDALRDSAGTVDVVIGIPTYNNARTIGSVMDALRDGFTKFLPDTRTVVVNADAGSADGTPEQLMAADWDMVGVRARHASAARERSALPYHGIPGRAAAQRLILEAALALGARACCFFPADSGSLTPDWAVRLLRPVLEEGADYVSARYDRRRYEGTLTTGLIYPLVRALYGLRIHQPLTPALALSGRFVARLCAEQVWETDPTRHGIDLGVIALASLERFTPCEVWLGRLVVEAEGRPSDLATIFSEAIGSTFGVLDHTADGWIHVRGSEPVPVMGEGATAEAGAADVNVNGMIRAFTLGRKDLLPLWEQALAPETLVEVLALEPVPGEAIPFPHELWARVVYDFALAARFQTLYRPHLLRSLVPLYLGRTAAYVLETSRGPARDADGWIEACCRAFEQQKPRLAERWR